MKILRALVAASAALAVVVATQHGVAGAGDDVLPKLKTSKHGLLEGIQQAQKDNGVAISAKLEFEEGKLWLSVYTAKSGLGVDAEHNVLMELKGDATAAKWEPKTEVFADKAHLARSATQLTTLQTTSLTLEDAIKKATAQKKGTIFSAIPAVQDGKSVVDVLIATPDGKATHVLVDQTTQ